MEKEEKVNKLKSIEEPQVLFRWRYLGNKIAGQFISITNLRLETVQIEKGKVLLSQSAPVVIMHQGKPLVIMKSDNITHITTGLRGGIVISGCSLREGEEGHVPKMSGSRYLNEESSVDDINIAYDMCSEEPYPGIDMRMPELFRCSANYSKFKPAMSPELYDVLGLYNPTTDVVQRAFIEDISKFSIKTAVGYIVPYSYVHAGGMIVVDGSNITRTGSVVYKRSLDFFKTYIRNKKWEIETV